MADGKDDAATMPFPSLGSAVSTAVPPAISTPTPSRKPPRKVSINTASFPGDTTGPALATLSRAKSRPSPVTSVHPRRRSNRRRIKSFLKKWKSISFKHTWLNPLLIILIVLGVYLASPGKSNFFYYAIFLSYPQGVHPTDPTAIIYGKGYLDFAFVAFYTVVLTFTREFIMQAMLRPLAIWCGIKSRSRQSRFLEQMYAVIYFGISSPIGLYVMWRSPVWYFSTPGMYADFPHRELEGVFKAYYLLQASYWAQQALVLMLMLEKPRKDFRELVAHHIITLSLIYLSYWYHFTHIGVAIYITHDISDFFLATSKTLNYLDSSFVDPYFAIFMAAWVYLRHYINLQVLASMMPYPSVGANPHPLALPRPDHLFSVNVPGFRDTIYVWPSQFSSIGSYELNWDSGQHKCWLSHFVTFFLLACLQAVNLFWLHAIFRVAYRFIIVGEKKDDRSDDEEDEELETDVPRLPTTTESEANGPVEDKKSL